MVIITSEQGPWKKETVGIYLRKQAFGLLMIVD